MIVKYVDRPFSRTLTLFGKAGELKESIVAYNSIRFIVRHETKTHLSISIISGSVSFKLNEQSPFSEENNLTMITKTEWNYFHGHQSVNHYFKLTKKQNAKVLENHIVSLTEKYIFEAMHLDTLINKDTFIIEIELPDDLRDRG